MNIDKKYRRILFELTKNSRIPLKQLARKVGLQDSTLNYRIQRLYKQGILTGTYAIIDMYKLGYRGFRAYITFQAATTQKEQEILKWLEQHAEVPVLLTATGKPDCIIISWCKDDLQFHTFIQELKATYQKNIRSLEVSNYVKAHHFQRNYLLEETQDTDVITLGNTRETAEHDQTDIEILRILSADARTSALEIGQQLGLQAKTIIDRMKRLEKNKIIAGYSCSIDLEKIGHHYEKFSIIFSENTGHAQLLSYAAKLPESIYVDEGTTQYDFELNLEVESMQRKNEILEQLKDTFSGIREVNTYSAKAFRKIQYLPSTL